MAGPDDKTCRVDLGGGATLESPCVGPFGWCMDADYYRARRVLAIERHKLLALINRYNILVGEGKATWDAAARGAWSLDDDAEAMLNQYPEGWAALIIPFKDPTAGFREIIEQMSRMASSVHSAACDISNAIAKLGEAVPTPPVPPLPPKGPTDTLKEGANNLEDAAGSVARSLLYLVGSVAVVGIAYTIWSSRSTSSPTVVVAAPAMAPLPPLPSSAATARSPATRTSTAWSSSLGGPRGTSRP